MQEVEHNFSPPPSHGVCVNSCEKDHCVTSNMQSSISDVVLCESNVGSCCMYDFMDDKGDIVTIDDVPVSIFMYTCNGCITGEGVLLKMIHSETEDYHRTHLGLSRASMSDVLVLESIYICFK